MLKNARSSFSFFYCVFCPRGGMADAADLKSDVERRVGSNPTGGTYYIFKQKVV